MFYAVLNVTQLKVDFEGKGINFLLFNNCDCKAFVFNAYPIPAL